MDFSKLIQDEFTPEWAKSVIHDLSPYPYLADILIILTSFVGGALFSLLLYLLLRPMLHRFYKRHCQMNSELLACIRNMIVFFVGCLPVVLVGYSVWCDGIFTVKRAGINDGLALSIIDDAHAALRR